MASTSAIAPVEAGRTEASELGNVIEAAEPLAVEAESESDADSGLGDDNESYTTSLNTLARDFEYENGRRYHAYKKGSYFLPNDEEENDRLDLYHHLVTLHCGGKLHLAPIGPNPQQILDVGTGTGIWAILMGDDYPSAQVLGNDLSPIQPAVVPPNVSFEIDDAEEDWVYSRRFDYIHCRYLGGSIKDWPRLISQCYKFLKPGGWVEFQDFDMTFTSTDNSIPEDSALNAWTTELKEGVKSLGLEPEPGPKLKGWVLDHRPQFANIHHQRIVMPIGPWPKDKKMKECGILDLIQFLDGLEGFSLRILTGVRNWQLDEVKVLLAKCRNELKNNRLHKVHEMHVVYAQRPY